MKIKLISIDQMCRGMAITVVRHINHLTDHSWEGDVLIVKAIDAPCIIVDEIGKDNFVKISNFKINTTKTEFRQLKQETLKVLNITLDCCPRCGMQASLMKNPDK